MDSIKQTTEKALFSKPGSLLIQAAVATGLVMAIVLNIIFIKPSLNELLDFGSFYAAGNAAQNGGNPYSISLPFVFIIDLPGMEYTLPSPNLNPPVSVLIFEVFTAYNPFTAVQGWRIATFIQYIVVLVILSIRYSKHISLLRILWALSMAGLWTTIALGQIYVPILLLATGAWLWMEKGRFKLAGIALGMIIALKPNFIFWLVLIGLTGNFVVVVSGVLTALVLTLIPFIMWGPSIYRQWVTALSEYPSFGILIAGNSSLQSLGEHMNFAFFGVIAAIVLTCLTLYIVYRNKYLSEETINSLGILGSLLISPFAWVGYTILTLPIFLSKPKWNWRILISALLMVFPYILVMYFSGRNHFTSVVFGWLYGWGLLILMIDLFVILNIDNKKKLALEQASL
jgi:hypothetical protein